MTTFSTDRPVIGDLSKYPATGNIVAFAKFSRVGQSGAAWLYWNRGNRPSKLAGQAVQIVGGAS